MGLESVEEFLAKSLLLRECDAGVIAKVIPHLLTSDHPVGSVLVRAGAARHIAVSMGHEGAVLAHAGGVIERAALEVPVKSATGAGDCFVAGMVHGFMRGADAEGAFRWGMAAGTAAVLSPGTDLAHPHDIRAMWDALGD